MIRGPSKRQGETLRFIRRFLDDYSYAPSLREIADHLGVSSVATVHQHVRALKEKGLIETTWNQTRSESSRSRNPIRLVS